MRSETTTELTLSRGVFPQRISQGRREEEPKRNIDVRGSLRRYRTLALSTALVCLALSTTFVALRHGTFYEAKSFVYVSPTFPTTLAEEKEQDRPYDAYIQDQSQTVTRYDIVAAAVQQLGVGAWQRPGESLQAAVARLQKQLEVERVGSTFQFSIALKAHSPQTAAAVVNAVTDTYIARARHEEFYGRDERLANLRQERTRLQDELAAKLATQASLMAQLGVASVGQGDTNPYDAQLVKLQADLATAREQRMQAEAQIASLTAQGASSAALEAVAHDAVTVDTGLSSLKSTLNQRRAQLVEQMNGLTPSNPLYKQDEAELHQIQSELTRSSSELTEGAAQRIQQKLQAEVYRTRMVEAHLQQAFLTQTHSATAAAPKFQQAKDLGKQIENLEASYAAVDERIRNLDLESSSPGSVHLSSPALAPLTPAKNRTWVLVLLLLAASGALSVGAAVGADLLDPNVYSPAHVEALLGFEPMGVLLDHDDFSHDVASQYLLRLAGGIQHARKTAGARTFLFTGLAPESGTTTVVERLGRQLRSLNLSTLTIAATNVDGKVSYITSTNEGDKSAASASAAAPALSGQTDARMVNKVSGASSMAVQPHAHGAPHPVYSGAFVSQVLDEVKNQYDIVLIDASPLLISADTEHLARVADGTVLLVPSGKAAKKQLARAARLLERLDVPGVAVALNRVARRSMDPALASDIEEFQQQLSRQRRIESLPSPLADMKSNHRPRPGTGGRQTSGAESGLSNPAPAQV